MPSGYTHELYEGKPQTFEQFALSCARAFGATIHQREDPLGSSLTIPENDEYYANALREAIDELKRLSRLTPAEADVEASAEYTAERAQWEEREERNAELKSRYRAMLADVVAWTPPSPEHVGLQEFMISQLDESLNFDCYETDPPVPQTGEEWLRDKLDAINLQITRWDEEATKERIRNEERVMWIQDLADSLGVPVKNGKVEA